MNAFTQFGTINVVYMVFMCSLVISFMWHRAIKNRKLKDEIPSDNYLDEYDDDDKPTISLYEAIQIFVATLIISAIILIAINVVYP